MGRTEETESRGEGEGDWNRDMEKVYDRQIRLWGAEAQAKLGRARLLFLGMGGIHAEVLKNVLLAGVRHVALGLASHRYVDSGPVFFYASAGSDRLQDGLPEMQKLNPNATLVPVGDDVDVLLASVGGYDAVLMEWAGRELSLRFADACHAAGVPFYLSVSSGLHALTAIGLPKHEFWTEAVQAVVDVDASASATGEAAKVRGEVALPSVSALLRDGWAGVQGRKTVPALWYALAADASLEVEAGRRHEADEDSAFLAGWRTLAAAKGLPAARTEALQFEVARALRYLGHAFNPVCAVVGGLLGQELVRVVTHRDEPLTNLLHYDAWNSIARVEFLDLSTLSEPSSKRSHLALDEEVVIL